MSWLFADTPKRERSPAEQREELFGVDVCSPDAVSMRVLEDLAAKMSRTERSVVAAVILHEKALGLDILGGTLTDLPADRATFVYQFAEWSNGLSVAQRAVVISLIKNYPQRFVDELGAAYAKSFRGCNWGY